jgi:hypothetical protein
MENNPRYYMEPGSGGSDHRDYVPVSDAALQGDASAAQGAAYRDEDAHYEQLVDEGADYAQASDWGQQQQSGYGMQAPPAPQRGYGMPPPPQHKRKYSSRKVGARVKEMVETGRYTREHIREYVRSNGLGQSRQALEGYFRDARETKRQAPLAQEMAETGKYTVDEIIAEYPTAIANQMVVYIREARQWYPNRDGSALMDGQTILTVDLLAGPNRRVNDFDKDKKQRQFPLEYNFAKEGEEAQWRGYLNPDGRTPAGIPVARLRGLADNREDRDALSAAGSALRRYQIRSEASGGRHSKEDATYVAKATWHIQASYQDKRTTGITPPMHPELQKILQSPRAAAIQEGIELYLNINAESANQSASRSLIEIAVGEQALFLEYRRKANVSSQAASTQQNIEAFRSRLPSERASSTDLVSNWNQNYAPAQAGGTFSSEVYYPASQSTQSRLPLPPSMRPGGEYYDGGQMDSSGRMAGSSNLGGAYVPPGMSGVPGTAQPVPAAYKTASAWQPVAHSSIPHSATEQVPSSGHYPATYRLPSAATSSTEPTQYAAPEVMYDHATMELVGNVSTSDYPASQPAGPSDSHYHSAFDEQSQGQSHGSMPQPAADDLSWLSDPFKAPAAASIDRRNRRALPPPSAAAQSSALQAGSSRGYPSEPSRGNKRQHSRHRSTEPGESTHAKR